MELILRVTMAALATYCCFMFSEGNVAKLWSLVMYSLVIFCLGITYGAIING